MMKKLILTFLFFFPVILFAQQEPTEKGTASKELSLREKADKEKAKVKAQTAPIDQYRIITLERDTTFVDTSLTIQKEYKFNYLRKDNFGLLPFANEGQTYNTLDFGLSDFSPYPEFGFKAKHFNFMEVNDIKYYSVATPITELYYKSVMEQGQTLDAFITLNTSKRLNFSIAYKGLRSIGKYINSLSSSGNFRFTTSYRTENNRYQTNIHFTAQDILNDENGGITSNEDFESGDGLYKERARLDVYFRDASSLLKGNRYFVDHSFRINPTEGDNNLIINHQFNYENKSFEFDQPTLSTRFGDSYFIGNIKDKVRYNKMYNKIGATYQNINLGEIQFFIDDFRYNYYYSRMIFSDESANAVVPNNMNDKINSVGGQYLYLKEKWNGKLFYSTSLSDQSLSNFKASLNYKFDDKNQVLVSYENMNKLPNHNYNLYQSGYINYNWSNNFKNEKINTIEAVATTQWFLASFQASTMKDHLYFSDNSLDEKVLLVTPKQYDRTINYLSFKLSKEFKFGRWALDNTILYQKVDQSDKILNVPEIVTRNTLYYTDYFFKKALFFQTGVTFNYFTNYYANNYNPLIGEFYIQEQKKIGDFPLMDIFINIKIRQTRIYLKAEHFNSSFTGYDFYSAPNYPYRDFMIRFGLVWNFFS